MKQYKPSTPFRTPFKILSLKKEFISGVNTQIYVEEDVIYFATIKSFGGTEKVINNVYVVEDTIVVETYFIITLKNKDRIKLLDDNSVYELINTPENINRQSQYMQFKAVRVHG
ncbi:MAG: hypothetical protein SPJ27_04605 [Candidatus Onthovivens sp.]|nr:hypothetical protein [Candidatus Onthovivens sp.]